MATQTDIIHAYRHLYRGLLQAVQFSAPARFLVRDQLRTAFRERDAAWNPEGIKRTLWFLQAAAKERGPEHRILKNLLLVRKFRKYAARHWKAALHEELKNRNRSQSEMSSEAETATRHFDMTVAMLNKSMGLCLR